MIQSISMQVFRDAGSVVWVCSQWTPLVIPKKIQTFLMMYWEYSVNGNLSRILLLNFFVAHQCKLREYCGFCYLRPSTKNYELLRGYLVNFLSVAILSEFNLLGQVGNSKYKWSLASMQKIYLYRIRILFRKTFFDSVTSLRSFYWIWLEVFWSHSILNYRNMNFRN